ncbi:putative basic amino acid antiporter YfcC [Romboutsia weinsteinii]|uniref:Putative basic amino acid antiporter YfcC n=1 Tax=Romboutsia weinsteinii TaxID=2020949 RepID=A0A371J908_9FIRM|nr:YfcC family protein [Romboutsia weinsteinii]RDY29158.1 putative basic amino acid antiporter YfcC [Romboutsia weinsteinii]
MSNSKAKEKEKKKGFKIPHTFTIIFSLIVLMAGLTWIVPSGEFAREDVDGRSVVVPGTYQEVDSNPQGVTDIFTAPINGFIDAAEVVGFVLLVGGAFGIVNKTGAIEAGIGHAVSKMRGLEFLIIPVSMILFALGGSTFGMCEETLPFYMIFIPLMTSLGYDSLTGIAVVFMGAATGVAASTINPFSVGIAQALADIAPGSGVQYRAIMFVILMAISIGFVMIYAHRVKKDPKKSIVYDLDKKNKSHFVMDDSGIKKFTGKEMAVLVVFIVGMITMVWGVLSQGWYIPEIAMIFCIIGLLSGIVGGLGQTQIVSSFIGGAGDMISAALAIALARGIVIVAQNGFIIDTILNSAAEFLKGLPKAVFINLTLLLENALAFLIPSSSGLASLTVPVLTPLGELVGVSGQEIVTSFQFGTGLTNMITPTSGVLMGALAVARIPWDKWFRFVLPLLAILLVTCMAFLTVGLYIGF